MAVSRKRRGTDRLTVNRLIKQEVFHFPCEQATDAGVIALSLRVPKRWASVCVCLIVRVCGARGYTDGNIRRDKVLASTTYKRGKDDRMLR